MLAYRTTVLALLLLSGAELQAISPRPPQLIAKFKAAIASFNPTLPRAAQGILAASTIFCSSVLGMTGCGSDQITKAMLNPIAEEMQDKHPEESVVESIVINDISYHTAPNLSIDSAFISITEEHGVLLFLQYGDLVISYKPVSEHHDIGAEVYFVGNTNKRITYLRGKVVRIYSIYYEITVEHELYDPDAPVNIFRPHTIIAWKKSLRSNTVSFINTPDILR